MHRTGLGEICIFLEGVVCMYLFINLLESSYQEEHQKGPPGHDGGVLANAW